MKSLLIVLVLCAAAHALVVFESYNDNACTTRLYNANPRLFFPVTDFRQGVDTQVRATFYSLQLIPDIMGIWTTVNSTDVIFNNGTADLHYKVSTQGNASVCEFVPCYGYGRFYNVPSPVGIAVKRTSGNLGAWQPTWCEERTAYGWVVYAEPNVLAPNAPCPTVYTDQAVFYDSATQKMAWFLPQQSQWTSEQACGNSFVPGAQCATSGLLYCTNATQHCNLDHSKPTPTSFPWGSLGTYTVKISTANEVGLSSGGSGSTTAPGSAGGELGFAAAIFVFVLVAVMTL